MDERARTDGGDPPAAARELFASYLVRREEGERLELEDLCREHPEHAAALRDLHADQERLERWLGHRSDDAGEPAAGGAAERAGAPERMGASGGERLRPLGEVARGGMGRILSVWDGELRRKLAMKVAVGAGERGPSPRELSRFLQEAQITAQLDHPGIVPVHELGVGRDGRAYFTMKLVRGRHLGAAFALARAGREGWTLARAVGVLVRVCETVAFAHSRGVVHRDLKPENVMVGDYGEAYVLDWGLARVHAERESDAAVESPAPEVTTDREELAAATPHSPLLTGEGGVVGTPAYLAPEQAEGRTELVGPSADVYSLGAMLYALLAGHAPYLEPGAELAPRALLARVRASPPRALAEIAPEAPAEIVAVCDKAMARDPARRYAGALELGEDLRSWLEGRVVRAHRTGARAELQKWVGRNRAFASASAALALVTVLGSLGFALQQSSAADEQKRLNGELSVSRDAALAASARADAEADRARAEAARAERRFAEVRRFATSLIFELHDPIAKLAGATAARRKLVALGLEHLESLAREVGEDPGLASEVAFAYTRLGQILGNPNTPNLDDTEGALTAFDRAAELWKGSSEAQPDDAGSALGRAQAELYAGQVLLRTERGDAALERFELALRLADAAPPAVDAGAREGLDAELGRPGYRHWIAAQALVGAGRVHEARGELDRAAEFYDQGAGRADDLRDAGCQVADMLSVQPIALAGQAEIARRRGDLPLAQELRERVLALDDELAAREPSNVTLAYNAAEARRALGEILLARGRAEEAGARALEATDRLRELVAREPAWQTLRGGLGRALVLAGNAAMAVRDHDAAAPRFEEAIAVLREACASRPGDLELRYVLARAHNQACTAWIALRRPAEGLADAETSLAMMRELHAAAPRHGAYAKALVASAYVAARIRIDLAADAERPRAEREERARDALVLLREAEELAEAFGRDGLAVQPTPEEIRSLAERARAGLAEIEASGDAAGSR